MVDGPVARADARRHRDRFGDESNRMIDRVLELVAAREAGGYRRG
jgi:hypothetical protein